MTTYGLTSEGFSPKPLDVQREEINAALRGALGRSIDLSDASALGQLVGIFAERLSLLWELAEVVAGSQDPDQATSTALDAVCALTGTIRNPASASSVTLTLVGTPATSVLTGSIASTASTLAQFATTADATIATLAVWVTLTAYAIGDRRSHAGKAYVCVTSGTSGAIGPVGVVADETDGTAHWKYLGTGLGAVDVAAEAVATGPTVAVAGDIATIETPVSGWTAVVNSLDADVGSNVETDESLRARRETELVASGKSPPDAIRAALLDVADVTACTVFYNVNDATDVDGIPGHAVEAMLRGGATQDICDTLLANVAAGIKTHGTVTGSANDSQGNAHVIKFTRPTEVLIYARLDVVKDASLYPADGDAQIKAAIVAWGDLQATGKDVVASALSARAFGVPGVLDVTLCYIRNVPTPIASTTIAIGLRELALYDTSRITINSSSGTP